MRASTDQGTDKKEKSRMHTESKIRGNNNASHRVSLRQSNIVSRRDGKENKERPNTKKDQIVLSTLRDTECLRIEPHLLDASKQTQRTRMPSNWLATHWTLFTQETNVATCVTAARCDHRATCCTWLNNVFEIARACSSLQCVARRVC